MRVVATCPHRGRARRGWLAGLLTVLCVLLAVTAVSASVVLVAPGQGNAASTPLPNQSGSLPWNSRTPLTALLIGANSGGTAPADSLIVAQYRPLSQSLSLLAIPGDLWVSVPGFGRAPISQAYADGGSRLALVAVQSVLHLPIPYYATIDPATARRLIDAIGSISISTTTAAGTTVTRQLDGKQTLEYVGIRPVDDGANRLRRELLTVLAAREPIFGPAALVHLTSLVSQFAGAVGTNIPYSAIPDLAAHLGRIHASAIHVAALDLANGSITHFAGNSTPMLLPDPAGAPALARQLLAAPTVRVPGGISVLNGSGVAGQANALGDWLRQAGIPVSSTGSANSFANAHTQVVVSGHASPNDSAAAQTISALLQIPVVQVRANNQGAKIAVLIGSDYQDPTQR